MGEVVRYSEAFKLRLVEDVAGGKYKSLEEARRRNGIRGYSTVSKWLKRYGQEFFSLLSSLCSLLPEQVILILMYIREIQTPRTSPIENGKPLQGTWNRAFDEVDLLDIRRPYRFLLPRWARNCRIKEWECFSIQDKRFFIEAFLGNVKLYRMAQVFLYDQETGRQFTFRKVIPGGGWRLPLSLANASVDSRSYGFFSVFTAGLMRIPSNWI
jgi:hypothetical protein